MSRFRKYLQILKDARAVVAFVLLAVPLVATSVTTIIAQVGMPARQEATEQAVDSLSGELGAAIDLVLEGQEVMQDHIREEAAQREVYAAERERKDCVMDATWEYLIDEDKTPINPNRCTGEN